MDTPEKALELHDRFSDLFEEVSLDEVYLQRFASGSFLSADSDFLGVRPHIQSPSRSTSHTRCGLLYATHISS